MIDCLSGHFLTRTLFSFFTTSSGVGNWVADEVLYQSKIHPHQNFLTLPQATLLKEKLHLILKTAISCLDSRKDFPDGWLFHTRWDKRSANSGKKVKDSQGRDVVFLKAAGRTSAIVPSIQIKRAQSKPEKAEKSSAKKLEKKRKSSESQQVSSRTAGSAIGQATTAKKANKKQKRSRDATKARAVKSAPQEKLRRSSRHSSLCNNCT